MTCSEIDLNSLRQRGIRITPQREMILNALAHAGGHLSAEEILARLKEHTRVVNIATVYRTLDMLVEAGLASRSNLCDGRFVYASRRHGSHLHLVCRTCGAAIDADSGLLQPFVEQVQREYHFLPDWQHLTLQGICEACHEKLSLQEA